MNRAESFDLIADADAINRSDVVVEDGELRLVPAGSAPSFKRPHRPSGLIFLAILASDVAVVAAVAVLLRQLLED